MKFNRFHCDHRISKPYFQNHIVCNYGFLCSENISNKHNISLLFPPCEQYWLNWFKLVTSRELTVTWSTTTKVSVNTAFITLELLGCLHLKYGGSEYIQKYKTRVIYASTYAIYSKWLRRKHTCHPLYTLLTSMLPL